MNRIALNASLFLLALTCSANAEPVYQYTQTEVGVGASTPGVVVFKTQLPWWTGDVPIGSEHEVGNACLVARHPGYLSNNYTPSDYIVTKYTVYAKANSSSVWLEPVAGAAIDSSGQIEEREAVDANNLYGLYDSNRFINMDPEPTRYLDFQRLAQACVDGGFAAVSDRLN